LTSHRAGNLRIATQPGLGLVDLIPSSSGVLEGGVANIASFIDGKTRTQTVPLGTSGSARRLKIIPACVGERIGLSNIENGHVLQSLIMSP